MAAPSACARPPRRNSSPPARWLWKSRCAITCAQNYRDADHVAHRGTAIRDWLTGAPNEEYIAGRYSAARQVLANVGGGSQRSPSPAEFVEAAARFARFVLAA